MRWCTVYWKPIISQLANQCGPFVRQICLGTILACYICFGDDWKGTISKRVPCINHGWLLRHIGLPTPRMSVSFSIITGREREIIGHAHLYANFISANDGLLSIRGLREFPQNKWENPFLLCGGHGLETDLTKRYGLAAGNLVGCPFIGTMVLCDESEYFLQQ